MRLLRDWLPALLWAAVIWTFSTHLFSSESTGQWLLPLLHWLFSRAAPETLELFHFAVRRCGHLTEYFILSLLLLRGVRGPRRGWQWSWALTALGLAAAYAVSDELHQAFVPERTPAAHDVLLDTAGAALGQAWAWWRLAKLRPHSGQAHMPVIGPASASAARIVNAPRGPERSRLPELKSQ